MRRNVLGCEVASEVHLPRWEANDRPHVRLIFLLDEQVCVSVARNTDEAPPVRRLGEASLGTGGG